MPEYHTSQYGDTGGRKFACVRFSDKLAPMPSAKRVCVFIDGENLRHSIVDLFPHPIFNKKDYLPMANWGDFFNWITRMVVDEYGERVRAYWYVVQNIDYAPSNLKEVCESRQILAKILSKNAEWRTRFESADATEQEVILHEFAENMRQGKLSMQARFTGWTHIQDEIARKCDAVEFRRAGSIRYDLSKRSLGSEKSVDVKLAVDLIRLKDIYDVAIIVSGDQDYVPAVDTIKDFGKRVVNVAFLTEDGALLPGGAKRLNQATDSNFLIKYSDLKKHLGL